MSDASLTEAERRTREIGDAASWTRFAVELSRAQQDPWSAALEAARLDPASPARELIPATWGATPSRLLRAVAWRGLRTLEKARFIEAPGPRHGEIVDLGRGLAAYATPEELVVIDVFEERVAWRAPGMKPAALLGGELVAVERDALRWFDLSGKLLRSHALGFEPHDTLPLDASALVLVRAKHRIAGGDVAFRGRRVLVLVFLDTRTGEARTVELPPLEHDPTFAVHAGELVVSRLTDVHSQPLGTIGLDREGKRSWERRQVFGKTPLDGRLLGQGSSATGEQLLALDMRTGEMDSWPSRPNIGPFCASEDVVVLINMGNETIVHDRGSLAYLWSTFDFGLSRTVAHNMAATGDALLLFHSEKSVHTLSSVEPRTGAILSTCSFSAEQESFELALVAGRVVAVAEKGAFVIS